MHPPIAFEIVPGESVRQVAERLEQARIVRSSTALLLLARMRELDRTIRYGTHEFAGALTPENVLR